MDFEEQHPRRLDCVGSVCEYTWTWAHTEKARSKETERQRDQRSTREKNQTQNWHHFAKSIFPCANIEHHFTFALSFWCMSTQTCIYVQNMRLCELHSRNTAELVYLCIYIIYVVTGFTVYDFSTSLCTFYYLIYSVLLSILWREREKKGKRKIADFSTNHIFFLINGVWCLKNLTNNF